MVRDTHCKHLYIEVASYTRSLNPFEHRKELAETLQMSPKRVKDSHYKVHVHFMMLGMDSKDQHRAAYFQSTSEFLIATVLSSSKCFLLYIFTSNSHRVSIKF